MCQDPATAAWASKPFRIGPPQWPTLTLRALVLGPHNVPVITDPSAAARDIPLATRIFAELTELGLGNALAAGPGGN